VLRSRSPGETSVILSVKGHQMGSGGVSAFLRDDLTTGSPCKGEENEYLRRGTRGLNGLTMSFGWRPGEGQRTSLGKQLFRAEGSCTVPKRLMEKKGEKQGRFTEALTTKIQQTPGDKGLKYRDQTYVMHSLNHVRGRGDAKSREKENGLVGLAVHENARQGKTSQVLFREP